MSLGPFLPARPTLNVEVWPTEDKDVSCVRVFVHPDAPASARLALARSTAAALGVDLASPSPMPEGTPYLHLYLPVANLNHMTARERADILGSVASWLGVPLTKPDEGTFSCPVDPKAPFEERRAQVRALAEVLRVPPLVQAPEALLIAGDPDAWVDVSVDQAARLFGLTYEQIQMGVMRAFAHLAGIAPRHRDYPTLAADAAWRIRTMRLLEERTLGHSHPMRRKWSGVLGKWANDAEAAATDGKALSEADQ